MGDILKLRKKLHAGQALSRQECWDLLDRVAALPPADDAVEALVKAAEIAIDVMEYVDGENDCSRGISALEAALAAIRAGGGQ